MMTALSVQVQEGLDFILGHLYEPTFPRTISTAATHGAQVSVSSKEEALARFTQANFLDCRISAYPPLSELSSFVGVNLDIAPNVVMIDLDRETFKTQRAFEMTLTKTLNKIRKTIISEPTVIWSGRGYHIYLVLDAFVLEREDVFNNNRFGSNPSQKFLRFAEWFLSNSKCDPQHNKTVSFRNCMLRIPGSINLKNGQVIRIIRKWNGYRPPINYLLRDFRRYLIDQCVKELNKQKGRKNNYKIGPSSKGSNFIIYWIEKLLQTPIADYRKLTVWHIFAPYLLNIRRLSYEKSFSIIRRWLDECNQIKRLDFNPKHRIKSALNNSKDFLPISCEKLKIENEGFYNLLLEKGVVP